MMLTSLALVAASPAGAAFVAVGSSLCSPRSVVRPRVPSRPGGRVVRYCTGMPALLYVCTYLCCIYTRYIVDMLRTLISPHPTTSHHPHSTPHTHSTLKTPAILSLLHAQNCRPVLDTHDT
ncbi:hypothetical protein GY45DRAFT_359965 [Cubamyces sp. BRFM 1775]|nr:hypothetical protein GY45DRAFT_359965 [Cubamyces sp. BRFM 1775]